MSNEIEDSEPELQRDLQRSEPFASDGRPDGRQAPDAPPAGPEAPVGQPGPSSPDVAALRAAGEPGTLPPTWCRRCQAYVPSEGKGRCGKCGTFLKLNFASRKHPVNIARRDQLLAEIVREYTPDTLELRDACFFLAKVKERLEHARDGTPEHQRLMTIWSDLSTQLREARAAARSRSMPEDLAGLSNEQLAARLEELTAEARTLAEAEAEGRARVAAAVEANRLREGDAPEASPSVAPAADPEPTPEATCEFCHQTITRCAEIKTTRIDDWRALHYSDPEEVQRRNDLATAEMMQQIGKPLPDWYR